MRSFEYISVLLSIVLALGIAHILGGITAMIEHRRHREGYWVLVAWCLLTLAFHVSFWIALWRFRNLPNWTFGKLAYFFIAVALLYVASRILVPETPLPANIQQHFSDARRPFFTVITLFWLLASVGPIFLGTPWLTSHRPFMACFTLLGLSGALVSSELYHSALVVTWTLIYVMLQVFVQGPVS